MRAGAAAPAAAVAAGAIAAVFAGSLLWGAMYPRNPQFEIKRIDITPGATKSPGEIRALAGIREGGNLCAVSADEIRRRILSAAPEIAEAQVSKTLPDRIGIIVRDRVPVALLLDERRALDADGLVFPLVGRDVGRFHSLPRIENGSSRSVAEAGRRLVDSPGTTPEGPEAKMARALRLVVALGGRPEFPTRVDTLDVSDEAYLVFLTGDNRVVRILWEEIPDDDAISDALDLLEGTLRDSRSARAGRLDIMRSTRKVHVRP